MKRVLFLTVVVAVIGSTGCYYHPFRQGYTCAPPVYSQPMYAAPAAPVYAPNCMPQAVQACPCP